MTKAAADQSLLQLLVRVFNQTIQYYYYFPDVIICGHHRLEKEEFDVLLSGGFIIPYHTDSFGKLYHLSRKAEAFLHETLQKKRHRTPHLRTSPRQAIFPFIQL
ncbi:MAG TPA: hypothetical protein VER36_00535 [Flavisolibacter sp.]|nr:hypothetical protein [Flavisolibacter sp.]